MITDPGVLLAIFATFIVGGMVKGVIGLGMPTVSLGLLTIAFDLPTAMAIALVPTILTNILQGFTGGRAVQILKRIWPFLLTGMATLWMGTLVLKSVDVDWLTTLLGLVLMTYGTINLAGFSFVLSPRQEAWAGPVVGGINGILAGMTGSTVVPGVMYLQALGFSRDELIQALGLMFSLSALVLAVAMRSNGLLSGELATLSVFAILPAFAGMAFGQRIRSRLSEVLFRRVFFGSLLLLGAYLAFRSIFA